MTHCHRSRAITAQPRLDLSGLNSKITAVVESHGRAVALSLHRDPCSDIRTADAHACLLRGRTLVAD